MPQKNNYSVLGFENALSQLLDQAKRGPVTVKTFLTVLSGRGKVLLLLFISLFFGQIPGIAIFFGIYMCYLGLRIAFNHHKIWLPQAILKKKIPSVILKKVFGQLLRFFKFMKRWTYPRLPWVAQNSWMKIMNGLMIALVGLSIAISPPVPLISFLAYIAVFLIGLGLLNYDGVYILVGYAFVISYFCLVLLSLHYFSISKIIDYCKG